MSRVFAVVSQPLGMGVLRKVGGRVVLLYISSELTPGLRAGLRANKETGSKVTLFSGYGVFGAQPQEGWNVTVTRFTPQAMKCDLASSPSPECLAVGSPATVVQAV